MTVFNNIPAAFVGTQTVKKAYFNNNIVFPSYLPINATGGTETTFTSEDKTYKVHTFTSDGTLNITDLGDSNGVIEYLIVAGGGAGGSTDEGVGAGGGGAGQLLTGFTELSSGTYNISVGEGGSPVTSPNITNGENGENSSAFGLTAIGGGGGGTWSGGTLYQPESGGSGGGGSAGLSERTSTGASAGSGLNVNAGGDGSASGVSVDAQNAGGGGGSAAAGQNGTSSLAGDGGNGLASSITGTETYYAAGGGGAARKGGTLGEGGLGGGGNGGSGTVEPTSGQSNTGSGGGGAGDMSDFPTNIVTTPGGAGGSGTVIVKYSLTEADVLPPAPTEPIALNVTDLSVFTHYSQRDGLVSYPDEEPPRVLLAPDPFQDEGGVVVTSAMLNDWDILTIETDALLNYGFYDQNPYFVMGIGQNDFQTNIQLNITNTTYGVNESVITGSTAPHSNALFVAANFDRNDEVLRFGGGGFTTQDYVTILPAQEWKTYKVIFTRDSTVETTITCDFYVDNSLINSFTATGALDKTTSSHLFLTGRMNSSVRNMKYLAE